MNSSSELTWWKNQVGREPLLTPAEEITLGTMIREWLDWPGGRDQAPKAVQRRGKRAQDRFIRANLRLSIAYVTKHCRHRQYHHDIEEMVSIANFGLMRAVEKFDPTKGYKFSTYSFHWLRQAISRWSDSHSGHIRRPVHHEQVLAKVRRTQNEHASRTGKVLSLEEALEEVKASSSSKAIQNITMEGLQSMMVMGMKVCSLDILTGEGEDHTLGDMMATDAAEPDSQYALDAMQRVRNVLEIMLRDERIVFAAAYGLCGLPMMTQEQIADRAGVDVEAIKTILNCARSTFRYELRSLGPDGQQIGSGFKPNPKGRLRPCTECNAKHRGIYGETCRNCWEKLTPEGRAISAAYCRELRRKKRQERQRPSLQKLRESFEGIAPAWLLSEDVACHGTESAAVVSAGVTWRCDGSDLELHDATKGRLHGNLLSDVLPHEIADDVPEAVGRHPLNVSNMALQLELCGQTDFNLQPIHGAA